MAIQPNHAPSHNAHDEAPTPHITRVHRAIGRARVRLLPRLDPRPGQRRREPRRAATHDRGLRHDERLDIERVFVERGVSGSKPLDRTPGGRRADPRSAPGRYGYYPEARSHVPLRARCARRAGQAEGQRHQPAHDRPGRRCHRQRHLQAGVHHPLRRGGGGARPHPRADHRGEGRSARSVAGSSAASRRSATRKGENGELVPVPEQQKAIRKMQRLRAKGASAAGDHAMPCGPMGSTSAMSAWGTRWRLRRRTAHDLAFALRSTTPRPRRGAGSTRCARTPRPLTATP